MRRIFIDDWLIKLLALIITFSLWFGVTGLRAPITTRLKDVTLSPRVSNEMEITNDPAEEVDLVITGDKSKIAQINKENLVVSLDLTDIQPGERTIQLIPDTVSVELPTGVKLEEIQPNKIAVKLEKVEEREIPVRVETEGSVASGSEIYAYGVSPSNVRVRGPASFVRSLNSISTEPVAVENRERDFIAQQVPLNVNPKIKVLDAAVDVTFSIGEKRIERLFAVPYQTENRFGIAHTILYGPASLLDRLPPESLRVIEETSPEGRPLLKVTLPADIQGQVQVKSVKFRDKAM